MDQRDMDLSNGIFNRTQVVYKTRKYWEIRMLRNRQSALGASQLAAVARLFSARVLQDLARNGRSALFGRLLHESSLAQAKVPGETVRSLFDAAFLVLRQKDHRHEYIYKSAIAEKILLGRHSLNTATMLTEFRVAGCKADVVILNGTSTAYEIKSERDRLDRLEAQLSAYLRVFAQVYVVTGENHQTSVLRSIPEQVGVLLLTDRYQISTVRIAVQDTNRIEPAVVFNSLRIDEVRRVLSLNGLTVPKVPNTQERSVLRKLFLQLAPVQVHNAMVQTLHYSRSQAELRKLIDAVPASLRAVVFSTPLRKQDHPTLLNALNTSLCEAASWT